MTNIAIFTNWKLGCSVTVFDSPVSDKKIQTNGIDMLALPCDNICENG